MAAGLVIAATVVAYGVVATDALGAVARWGTDLRPMEALPARVVIDGFPVGPPVTCEPMRCQTWSAIGETEVVVTLETSGRDHVERLLTRLRSAGYRVDEEGA